MGLLGTPLGMQDAPAVDISGAAALIVEDPGFEYLNMARRVPRPLLDLSQIREFFRNHPDVFFLTYSLRIYKLERYARTSTCCLYILGP